LLSMCKMRFYCLSLTSLSSELGLAVNTKVVGMDVSFLMPLVSRQNDI
jgi:hypothetical protein